MSPATTKAKDCFASLAIVVIFICLIAVRGTEAMPVAYEGSFGVMAFNQADFQEWDVNYSITNHFGLGLQYAHDATGTGQYYFVPRFNWLVHRWNGTDSQANLYVYGGYGVGKRLDITRGVF